MAKKGAINKKIAIKTAKEKIKQLFQEAENAFSKDSSLANMYIRKARRAAMKHQIRLPKVLQRRFCKHCYSFLMPGKNLRIRTQKGHVVYYCLECRKFTRFPYKKEQKQKRKSN
ncbi:MAG: ribonuclease P [Nanoarchaeota archaeon]|nr:ribonuclease P [Thermodesulfovibrionia bacterium]MCK5282873.1 ribonuclease P [Nanoarchaeota archaeon]